MNEVKEYFKKWGSVCRMYKVGKAIHCHDTLLIFAKNYHEEQVKKFAIADVSQQRELLISYTKYYNRRYKNNFDNNVSFGEIADDFLRN